MQFASLGFVIILPVVMLVNALLPREYRYIWLALVSLGFYFVLDWKSGIVMVASILMTYGAGLILGKKAGEEGGRTGSQVTLVAAIAVSVAMLFVLRSGSILCIGHKKEDETAYKSRL